MTELVPPTRFIEACRVVGVHPTTEQLDRLAAFLDALLTANQQINLTAIRDPEEAWMRHVLESLALIPRLPDVGSLVDVGTGGGLPGIPLVIMLPDLKVTLVEATGKKCEFLQNVIRKLKLSSVTVLNGRAEDVGRAEEHRGCHDVIVARAVGSLSELMELSLPLLRCGGMLLAIKGRSAEEELERARGALVELAGEIISVSPLIEEGSEAVVIEIRKTAETPDKYPRRAGMPKKRPL